MKKNDYILSNTNNVITIIIIILLNWIECAGSKWANLLIIIDIFIFRMQNSPDAEQGSSVTPSFASGRDIINYQ